MVSEPKYESHALFLQPYIDESNKEKAKYSQELAASDEHDDIEDTEKEHNPLPHGDYSVQPDIEKPQVCNQSALDLANQTMKRPPADPVLQNDWEL